MRANISRQVSFVDCERVGARSDVAGDGAVSDAAPAMLLWRRPGFMLGSQARNRFS